MLAERWTTCLQMYKKIVQLSSFLQPSLDSVGFSTFFLGDICLGMRTLKAIVVTNKSV